jgi:hypothetical protein
VVLARLLTATDGLAIKHDTLEGLGDERKELQRVPAQGNLRDGRQEAQETRALGRPRPSERRLFVRREHRDLVRDLAHDALQEPGLHRHALTSTISFAFGGSLAFFGPRCSLSRWR